MLFRQSLYVPEPLPFRSPQRYRAVTATFRRAKNKKLNKRYRYRYRSYIKSSKNQKYNKILKNGNFQSNGTGITLPTLSQVKKPKIQ